MKDLTHINDKGDPGMVDVTEKQVTVRTAIAQSIVQANDEIIALLNDGEIKTHKGPVFQTAIIAGIMAVKRTSDLIPMCHPLPINKCDVNIEVIEKNRIKINCFVKTEGKTGVEMEALAGASISALTIYDMCKSYSKAIEIVETKLIEKKGGKSDYTTS